MTEIHFPIDAHETVNEDALGRKYKMTSQRYTVPINVAICLGEKRQIIKGTIEFALAKGRVKWKDELQITWYQHKDSTVIVEEKRNPSKWNSVEVNLPLDVGVELLRRTVKSHEVISAEDERRKNELWRFLEPNHSAVSE